MCERSASKLVDLIRVRFRWGIDEDRVMEVRGDEFALDRRAICCRRKSWYRNGMLLFSCRADSVLSSNGLTEHHYLLAMLWLFCCGKKKPKN